MGRVLLTGVAGFIGRNLAAGLLRLGFELVGIDDLSSGTLRPTRPGTGSLPDARFNLLCR